MTTTMTAPNGSKAIAAIPEADLIKMDELDAIVTGFRSSMANPDMASLRKMIVQARAIAALEAAITDDVMNDIMHLQGNVLGFKTDRDSKGGYDKAVVKRVVIIAWLLGANMTGNEVNIIAGNCYLTKGFTFPQIMRTPGLSNFEFNIGVPVKNAEKTVALFEANASWEIRGELIELECRKSEQIDSRIVVKCYDTSSPDELKGKAEAKLFQRVLQRITGIGLYDPENEAAEAKTIDAPATATPIHPAIEQASDDPQDEPATDPPLSDSAAAKNLYDAFVIEVGSCEMVNNVRKVLADRLKLLATAEWSEALMNDTRIAFEEVAADRIRQIAGGRGEKTNRK